MFSRALTNCHFSAVLHNSHVQMDLVAHFCVHTSALALLNPLILASLMCHVKLV